MKFPTWSRIVNNVLKESMLDHVNLTDTTICKSFESFKPCFGDHLLVTIIINACKSENVLSYKRNWKNYSKEYPVSLLNDVEWFGFV